MAKSSEISREKFVNPYNFISLQDHCSRGKDYLKIRNPENPSELLTGWIECNLKTLTPIFIPNTSDSKSNIFGKRTIPNPKKPNNKPEQINSYDFFSYTNLEGTQVDPAPSLPVIPGSEIRGMIRSAFEALTNSCLSTIDKDRALYKRTTSAGDGCGVLYFAEQINKWVIWKCERYGIAINRIPKDLKERDEIYIQSNGKYLKQINGKPVGIFYNVSDIKTVATPGYKKGWFHRGEKFGKGNKKHHESVFVEINTQNERDKYEIVPNEALECLIENFKLYDNSKINLHKQEGYHKGYKHIFSKNISDLTIEDLNNLPVYYKIHNGRYYLSPAAIGREVFYNTLDKILENKGGYQPCTERNNLCSACALFGTAEKDNAVASRVRFTDALIPEDKRKLNNSEYFEEVKILPELASPKPSAVEFYLKRPDKNVAIWNYDYAVMWKNGNKNNKEEIDNYQPTLRGRKFYWHHKIDNAPEISNNVATDRNVAVRPLRKDIDFKFRVYFNNITENELKNLIWTIEIGGNKNNAHKIGMGKPVGLGSVQIEVSDVKRRIIDFSGQSVSYLIDSKQDIIKQVREEKSVETLLGCNKIILDEFQIITDYQNVPANVMYPRNEGSDKTYEWFVSNKIVENTGGTGTNPFIHKELPLINEPVLNKYK